MLRRDLGNILLSDIEPRPDRQSNGSPDRMPHDQPQCYPDMSVAERIVGGAWGGVVMNSGSLNLGAVSLRRCVVDPHHQPRLVLQDLLQHQNQDASSQFLPAPSHALQKIIIV